VIGATLPLRSVQLILRQRSLAAWSLVPIAITLILYVFLVRYLQGEAFRVVGDYLAARGWHPEGWLTWVIRALSFLVIFIVSALTFSFVATVAASPFNDFLAERTEAFARPALAPVGAQPLTLKIRLVAIDVAKSVAAAVAGIAAILMSWIPLVNLAAFAVSFLLVTFQFISYPQTRRGQGLGEGIGFLWRHLYACLGFGAVTSFFLAIPILSCLATPVAVVGGTLLVARAPGDKELLALK
jgi:uncharacterized protein involved in cysteine biosynthesis